MRRSIPLAVAAAVFLAACGGTTSDPGAASASGTSSTDPTGAAATVAITGRVTTAGTGAAIAGATVSGESLPTVFTAADGTYKMSAKPGSYTLTASKDGYTSASSQVQVSRKSVATVNFSLAPLACTYTYSDWTACQSNGTQTRTVLSASPTGCTGTPVTEQSCTPPVSTCTYTYGDWGTCQPDGTQTRTVLSSSPTGCTGTPVTQQSCTYAGGGTVSGSAFKVFANNDLGMHCVDSSFAVFSILPPYNVVDAQVVALSSTGKPVVLDASSVRVSYAAVADATGSVNSTSIGKSDFWSYALQLYGAALAPGQGLEGMWMPKDAPNASGVTLHWDTAMGLFKAPGIPIFPTDDAGKTNPYPLMRFSAYDGSGKLLGSTDTVLPVSGETSCANCHATGKVAAPGTNVDGTGLPWSTDSDLEAQSRKNVLLLHDARNATSLQAPVLCANCHYSPALDLGGTGPSTEQQKHHTMSSVMHAFHANKMTGLVDAPVAPGGSVPSPTAQACYQCHPGAKTQCLRGAMTQAVDCQNCHGNMAAVGGVYPLRTGGSIDGTNDGKPRRPWLDLPRCQSCHANDAVSKTTLTGAPPLAGDGLRFVDAFVQNDPSASPILATNKRFAEETGKLYRKSKGHGGMACEACHGSTHAIWSANTNDNVAATQAQGHAGTIGECSACHLSAPTNGLGGPHGMHPINSSWVSTHNNFAQTSTQLAACQACHGTDYRGTVLSRTFAARSFAGKSFAAGTVIGCYSCHNGPNP